MNTQNYAVIVNENTGGLPSCIYKNSQHYWDFMQAGYISLNEGTKRQCQGYLEEYMSQLIDVEYFS